LNPFEYQDVLESARETILPCLDLSEQIIYTVADEAPGSLRQRLMLMLERPGKRIRSTLLMHLAATGSHLAAPERIARAAASIELLHLASLIHDDVIDETDTRRGQKSAHALWGNQVAVLVGDYALSKALELVVADRDNRIPIQISQASARLVAGEIFEIDLAGQEIGMEQYYEVIDGKTAALIEAAAGCGAVLAGHPQSVVDGCRSLGRHFGISFQIIDDLLDFGVGAGDLGKAKFSDLANSVTTLPLLCYMQAADEAGKAQMRELRNRADQPGVPEQVVALLAKSGAFDCTQKYAMDHVAQALAILQSLPPSPSREHLLRLLGTMAFRNT